MADPDPRIDQMHRRDVTVAWAFVLGLWLAMGFVLWATWDLAPTPGLRLLLIVGALFVLVFNTAAILAMLAHYREDRDFMYGLDLRFLDALRAGRG